MTPSSARNSGNMNNRAHSIHHRCARYFLVVLLFLCGNAWADQGITAYKPNSNGKVTRGCEQIIFITQGVFTGTIGNATLSSATGTQTVIPITAVGDNKVLGEVPYTLGGAGSLIIVEVR